MPWGKSPHHKQIPTLPEVGIFFVENLLFGMFDKSLILADVGCPLLWDLIVVIS